MKKMLLLSFFCGIFFISCDPYTGAIVVNNSDKRIKVGIKYYKNQKIKEFVYWQKGFGNFVKFQMSYNSSDGKLIGLDTINYVATVELNPKDSLLVWGGIRQSNDFNEIDEVFIKTNYKKQTIKGSDIQDVFEQYQGGLYVYSVD